MRYLALLFISITCLWAGTASFAAEVSDNVKSIIEINKSFGLNRYPISFWSYTNLNEHGEHMTEAEVESWADAGFTVPQSPGYDPTKPEQVAHIRKMLDWAQARNMKLILCDPRCYMRNNPDGSLADDYATGVEEAYKQFGDHPAVFGFHIGDEPHKDHKAAFAQAAKIQTEIAKTLHPFGNHLPWTDDTLKAVGNATWDEYLDEFCQAAPGVLLGYDFYMQMFSNTKYRSLNDFSEYFENLRYYREASLRHGVPFWNTILSVGHYDYRCPSYDDLRWQFNTSLCAGANGIAWFFYYMREPHHNYRNSPVDEHWDKTQTYYDIRKIQKSFHRFYGDLFTRIVCTKVQFTPTAWGKGEIFTPNELVSSITADGVPMMIGYFTDIQGQKYVMIVNNSTSNNAYASVTFPGANTKTYSWNWNGIEHEGGAYSATGSSHDENGITYRHWLAPGQEAVYRVEIVQ